MSGSAAPSSKREVPGSGSVEVVALLLLVEGVLLRSWIYVASPLPSDTPLAWFALGTAQLSALLLFLSPDFAPLPLVREARCHFPE